jgi:hypothetical protein
VSLGEWAIVLGVPGLGFVVVWLIARSERLPDNGRSDAHNGGHISDTASEGER